MSTVTRYDPAVSRGAKVAAIQEALGRTFRRTRFGYDLPTALVAAWASCGPDFQLEYDLADDEKLDDLLFWWILHGRREFPGTRDLIERHVFTTMHLDHLPRVVAGVEGPVTPLMALLLRHRPDLATSFDVFTAAGIAGLWKWWFPNGQREIFGQIEWVEAAQVEALHRRAEPFTLNQPGQPTALVSLVISGSPSAPSLTAADAAQWWHVYFSQVASARNLPNGGFPLLVTHASIEAGDYSDIYPAAAVIAYHARPDLRAAFDVTALEGRTRLLAWFYSHGLEEYPSIQLDPSLLQRLREHGNGHRTVPKWAGWLRDLVVTLDPSAALYPDNGAWWSEKGRAQFAALDALLRNDSQIIASAPITLSVAAPAQGSGISLVGYPRGEFGLGEDIRLLRASLRAVGVEPEVIRAPWQISARQSLDEAYVEGDTAAFAGDVIFYVMPAFDTLTLLNRIGPRAFTAPRRIGFWQWELARFPESALIAMEVVDEIWCHSEHAARAFRGATNKPVIKVPLPVSVPEVGPPSRERFGLPANAFVVFTSFDGSSGIARKNPLGAIRAFQQAFPRGDRGARLLLKAMNVSQDALWRECRRQAAADPRIIILNEVMDRQQYYDLLVGCDAVLSLHRAEGFGRLMAEAMALGIPTIASGYSGNLDFMTEENSWLVPGTEIPVYPGDYAFYQNQTWFEPDIAKAAEALRDCRIGSETRARRVMAAKATMVRGYAPDACGRTYLELLR